MHTDLNCIWRMSNAGGSVYVSAFRNPDLGCELPHALS